MVSRKKILLFFVSTFILHTSNYGQISGKNILNVDGCLCFYLNTSGKDKFFNYGLYNSSILKYLKKPQAVLRDSVFYYSENVYQINNKMIFKELIFDVPDLTFYNMVRLSSIIQNDFGLADSNKAFLKQSIYNTADSIVSRNNFFIISWIKEFLRNRQGIYIKCRPINTSWYIAKYNTFENKLEDLKIEDDKIKKGQIEIRFKKYSDTVKIISKDTAFIAYPLKLR